MIRSLYLHFPFCETKCHYCDFYSLGQERTRPEDHGRFERALHAEIKQTRHKLAPELDTLFLGGGTPSMTAYDSMARALEPLWETSKITEHSEWTMEANPSSITLESFQSFRRYGVNRVSMGVQAIRTDFLKLLGRVHSGEEALHALENVFAAGFENVSVDLLCGIPGQTTTDLENALKTFAQFPINHLSCYLLTLPPHHRLYSQLPDEEEQLSHLLFIHEWLSEAGFDHYEISNFAKPGKRARHNLNYWTGKSYLGLGPSAHSYDAQTCTRWKNVSSLHRYASLLEEGKSVNEGLENLTPEQRELEKWMLTLRLDEGFPSEWLTTPERKSRAQALEKQNLLELHPNDKARLRLTPKGFALSDQVIRSLV